LIPRGSPHQHADTRNGQDRDIFAQRVLASGLIDPSWPVNGAPVCIAPDVQINPVILADGRLSTWFV
jgi:hypothetical protein